VSDVGATSHSGLAFLWAGIGPYQRRALAVLALVLADTALASLGVGIVLPVFQALLAPDHGNALLERVLPFLSDLSSGERLAAIAGGTVLVFFIKASISFATTFASNDLLLRLRFYWVTRIGENYLYGPHQRLAGRKQGELLNDWFNETLAASRFYQSYITYLSSLALVIALTLLGLAVNWQAILILLTIGGVFLLLVRQRVFGKASQLSKLKLHTNQAITAAMVEDIANVRDIKLLLAEEARLGLLNSLGSDMRSILLRGAVMADLPKIAGEFLAVFGLMAFLVVSVVVMSAPPHGILPMLAFFFVAFYRLILAASQLMSSRVKSLNELHSLRQVQRMVAIPVEREDREHGLSIARVETDIRLTGLGYAYDSGVMALTNLDVVIPRGRLTLLLGPSGSGKSTLLDLLLRLTTPATGQIQVNGQDIQAFNLAQWRACFGYVSQEAALFNGSIRMNLLLALPGAQDEQIEAACRLAGADDFIRALPQGYDTVVGDRGQSLSGGQRKRIAIARALIRQPSVLVLDEATTAFEQTLEKDMLQSLRTALPELTIIQVTHRLQAAENADEVIALDQGRVVAVGAWNEVKPKIAPLFARQSKNEDHASHAFD